MLIWLQGQRLARSLSRNVKHEYWRVCHSSLHLLAGSSKLSKFQKLLCDQPMSQLSLQEDLLLCSFVAGKTFDFRQEDSFSESHCPFSWNRRSFGLICMFLSEDSYLNKCCCEQVKKESLFVP